MYFEDLNNEPEVEKDIAGYVTKGRLVGKIFPIYKDGGDLHHHIALVVSSTSIVYLYRHDVLIGNKDVLEVLYG